MVVSLRWKSVSSLVFVVLLLGLGACAPLQLGSAGIAEPPALAKSPAVADAVAPPEKVSALPRDLTDLLTYLGVDYTGFAPRETRYFTALRDLLARQGIVSTQDSLDHNNFRHAVRRFQASRPSLAGKDGIPDGDTLWELQVDWAKARRLELVRVSADTWPGRTGLDRFDLREDVAEAYGQLRSAVKGLGGVVTSDGALRELTAQVSAGRSPKSLHYTGIALDLATSTGMQDPNTDPYIITKEGDGWRVWARAAGGATRTLDAVVWSRGQVSTRPVTAQVIDFTDLASRFGFQPISANDCFPQTYTCAEWWHFQDEGVLVPFISEFGTELLSLARYSETQLRAAEALWNNRKAIFYKVPGCYN